MPLASAAANRCPIVASLIKWSSFLTDTSIKSFIIGAITVASPTLRISFLNDSINSEMFFFFVC